MSRVGVRRLALVARFVCYGLSGYNGWAWKALQRRAPREPAE